MNTRPPRSPHRSMRAFISLALLLAMPACAWADGLVIEVSNPSFTVRIPNVPSMSMEPHPLAAKQSHLRLLGSEGPFVVTVLTPTADAGMTAKDCAGSTIGGLPKRLGVPPQSQIYKARSDPQTFIAIYGGRDRRLHAHLFSAAPGYCIEVHVSKDWVSAEEARPWFGAFSAARIEAR